MTGEISQSSLSSYKGLPMSHKVPLKVHNNPLPGQKGLLSCHKGPCQATCAKYHVRGATLTLLGHNGPLMGNNGPM